MANKNITGRPGLFRRHGERIRAGLRSDPEGLGRSHIVVKSIEDIESSQLVGISLESAEI
ncbi:MAG: hypothetical protein J2P21_08980 [Chloracidobacterium sp.]|nr:hypothetical protein [Chloracidobacterium sp.]